MVREKIVDLRSKTFSNYNENFNAFGEKYDVNMTLNCAILPSLLKFCMLLRIFEPKSLSLDFLGWKWYRRIVENFSIYNELDSHRRLAWYMPITYKH